MWRASPWTPPSKFRDDVWRRCWAMKRFLDWHWHEGVAVDSVSKWQLLDTLGESDSTARTPPPPPTPACPGASSKTQSSLHLMCVPQLCENVEEELNCWLECLKGVLNLNNQLGLVHKVWFDFRHQRKAENQQLKPSSRIKTNKWFKMCNMQIKEQTQTTRIHKGEHPRVCVGTAWGWRLSAPFPRRQSTSVASRRTSILSASKKKPELQFSEVYDVWCILRKILFVN